MSAWPTWRAVSSIMWTRIQRRLTSSFHRGWTTASSSEEAAATISRLRSHSPS
jgi:hypothetical protein